MLLYHLKSISSSNRQHVCCTNLNTERQSPYILAHNKLQTCSLCIYKYINIGITVSRFSSLSSVLKRMSRNSNLNVLFLINVILPEMSYLLLTYFFSEMSYLLLTYFLSEIVLNSFFQNRCSYHHLLIILAFFCFYLLSSLLVDLYIITHYIKYITINL